MPFITQGKTNIKYILIVVILAAIAGGGILGYYYLWIKDLETRLAVVELKMPEKIVEDETADWKVYRNDELKYEFRYPPNWLKPSRVEGDTSFVIGYPLKDGSETYWVTLGFISQTQLSVMGVTYCAANPNDTSRCEPIKIGGVNSIIDWGLVVPFTKITKEGKEEQSIQMKANAWIPHSNGGIVTLELQPVVPESKETFYRILSIFKFLD